MPTNNDPKRVFDGWKNLAGGMDGNSDPSLLAPNQSAFYGNISLRSDFPRTRPNFVRRILNFDSAITQSDFAGMFQGATFYESLDDETLNSLIVSIAGHLFRIYPANNFLTQEITPAVNEVITSNFTVPAVGSTVVVNVVDSSVFSVNQALVIDGGVYVVSVVGADQLTLTYNGGALNTGWVVPALTAVLNGSSVPITVTLNEQVTAYAGVPSIGTQVNLMVTSETAFTLNQALLIDGGSYTINVKSTNQLTVTYNGGALHSYIAPATPIMANQIAAETVGTGGFTPPTIGLSVVIPISGTQTDFTAAQPILVSGGSYLLNAQVLAALGSSETVGTAGFTPPAIGTNVIIPLSGASSAFTAGQYLAIASGGYLVVTLGSGQITCTYMGGSTASPVTSGTAIKSGLYCTYNGGTTITPVAAGAVIYGAQTTVTLAEVTTNIFTVPAIGSKVTIPVTSELGFSTSESIIIGGENFTVQAQPMGLTGAIIAIFTGGVNHVISTTNILAISQGGQVNLEVVGSGGFTVPALGATVVVPVTSSADFSVGQYLYMDSGIYLVTVLGSGTITVMYAGGAAHSTVAAGVFVFSGVLNQVVSYATNPPDADFVYLWQDEGDVTIVCENQNTLYFDGSSTYPMNQSRQQLQSSYCGCYAWGRNWMPQVNGHYFIASDLVGDPSGTPANNYRDAIRYMTENNLQAGGGAFSTPANLGKITALSVLAQLDTSLGIGPVLVGTTGCIFSVQAPVDRTTWQNLTYPIQSVAVQGAGPTGPRALLAVNSDAWFRALDGVRSLVASRRDFQSNRSNTPNSIEMSPIFDYDDQSLLFYAGLVDFDNRTLFTASPYRTSYGVAHRGIAALNRDAISGIKQKDSPPIWEGLWTGLNIFQLVTGIINGVIHCYAFVLNNENGIDLWEIMPEVDGGNYDIYDSFSLANTPVNTIGMSYIGSPIPTATVNVTSGKSYVIAPGPNENGVILVNGSQSVVLVSGIPVTITSQGSTILFQYPNLVPVGLTYFGYSSIFWNTAPENVPLNILWGVIEASIDDTGGNAYNNTGVGTVSITSYGSTSIVRFNPANSIPPDSLVSSKMFNLASGLPLTATITTPAAAETFTNTPIASWIDSRAMNFGDDEQLKKLIMGELYIDEIVDNVTLKVYWKTDQYPLWTLWTTVTFCATVSQCNFNGCVDGSAVVWQANLNQYAARLTIMRPSDSVNNITSKPMDRGFEFQFRFEITGPCRLRKFKAHAVEEQMEMEGACPPTVVCKALTGCLPATYSYNSYG